MPRKPASPVVKKNFPDVVVVGAGAFGGWTAFHLAQHRARVTLLDAWGAGHPRATSSGETRLIRCGYGAKAVYTAWAWRALALWKHWQREWRTPLLVPSGVLWLCQEEDEYVRASLAALEKHHIPCDRLSREDLGRRFPQFNLDGIAFAYFEPQSGFLRARVATQTVASAVSRNGGRVQVAAAEPPKESGRRLQRLRISGGEDLRAAQFVFACGPWLPQLFPDLLSERIRVTKQEVLFFGPPAGDRRFELPALTPWIELASGFYGVPASDGRGLKVADDRTGPPFDPTHGDRVASPESVESARRYLAHRFPEMAAAPLLETRVCQYERTPDSHLLMDRHPGYDNVWIVGGGSGHGFKLGPAVGELLARHVLALAADPIPPEMRLGAAARPAAASLSTSSF